MRRFLQPWVLFGTCVLILLSAMGWLSLLLLQLDLSSVSARRNALLEETSRLALWRMDSAMASLMAAENARPAFEYEAFFPIESTYTRLFTEIRRGDVLVPSPLLTLDIPGIRLHFQYDTGGHLSSPQVPEGNMRDLAESSSWTTPALIQEHANDLARVSHLLNRDRLLFALNPSLPTSPVPAPEIARDTTEEPAQLMAALSQSSDVRQSILNTQEYAARQKQLSKSAPTAPPPTVSQPDDVLTADLMDYTQPSVESMEEPASVQVAGRFFEDSANDYDKLESKTEIRSSESGAAQFEPFWAGSELFAVRRSDGNGVDLIQAFWLDWPYLRQMLLDTIRDLLPEASLAPVADPRAAMDMRRLAAIPVRLIPGSIPALPDDGLSAVQVSLAIAWLGVLGAIIAAAILLRGVIALSERRAAFVSAVTHELRTPLTTFRMYAEMLADGMVPQPERQQEYFGTLRTESERLGHLVENVLLFARLEKSRVEYHLEPLELRPLLERIAPRLRERADQAGMELVVETGEAGGWISGEPAAVERILFNLVDNACKYAAGATDRRIVIRTDTPCDRSGHGRRRTAGKQVIRVSDSGPGIGIEKRKKLFTAFNKSSKEAAGTAPGVGLGLALSRRLARKMGGELILEVPTGDGAVFALILKKTDDAG